MSGVFLTVFRPGRSSWLVDLLGISRFAMHDIINDTTGELRRQALGRYKTVLRLERRQRRRERVEKWLFIRDLRRLYRENQAYQRAAGDAPGLPALDRPKKGADTPP